MLNAKLMIIGGDAVQTEVQLKLPTTIGRGRESNLTVPHALVSRRHTEIIERDGRLFVRDLGSLNGTFVNNKRIVEETSLDPDQLLTLGNITFRAVYEIGDDGDTGRISTNDTEVIDVQQSDTEKVASDTDPSSSSLETIPVDSLSKSFPDPQDAVDQDRKKTAYDNTNEANDFAAGEATGPANFESTQSYPGTMRDGEVVSTEPVEAAKLDSVKMELDAEANQDGEGDSGLGSFLRRLPR
jgi:pSer/pThr/pTyr-binding forkhead associated (FHA) protein